MATNPSGYELIKSALVTQLNTRKATGGGLQGVEIDYQPPEKAISVLAQSGQRESLYFGDKFDSEIENVVFCDGGLRFDETYLQEAFILVLGKDSSDTQQAVDERADRVEGEVLAELSAQGSWDHTALGLTNLAKLHVLPAGSDASGGRIGDSPAHACFKELRLYVELRWRPPA